MILLLLFFFNGLLYEFLYKTFFSPQILGGGMCTYMILSYNKIILPSYKLNIMGGVFDFLRLCWIILCSSWIVSLKLFSHRFKFKSNGIANKLLSSRKGRPLSKEKKKSWSK